MLLPNLYVSLFPFLCSGEYHCFPKRSSSTSNTRQCVGYPSEAPVNPTKRWEEDLVLHWWKMHRWFPKKPSSPGKHVLAVEGAVLIRNSRFLEVVLSAEGVERCGPDPEPTDPDPEPCHFPVSVSSVVIRNSRCLAPCYNCALSEVRGIGPKRGNLHNRSCFPVSTRLPALKERCYQT